MSTVKHSQPPTLLARLARAYLAAKSALAPPTVGPNELVRFGFIFLIIGILFVGVGVAGGIMVSTGVVLRWLDARELRRSQQPDHSTPEQGEER